MSRPQHPVPELKPKASLRSLIRKLAIPKASSTRNLKSSGVTIPLHRSRYTRLSPFEKDQVIPLENEDSLKSEETTPKERIVIAKLCKYSDIEFGIVSQDSTVLKPLEPFSSARRKEYNRSPLTISPKNALLYKDDQLNLLFSKFQRPGRNQSNHSMDVKRNDIDDFCKDKPNAIKILTLEPKKGPTHRRKSCVCSWCGGASALEKVIQNHPGIPATICHNYFGESKPTPTSDYRNTPTSASSRQSSFRRLKTGTPVRTPKKSAFGTFLQAYIALAGTPRNSARSSQTVKISLTEDIKTELLSPDTPVDMKRIQLQAVESPNSQRSFTFEEDSPVSISPKNTLSFLNKGKPIASLTWGNMPKIYESIRKIEGGSRQEVQAESEGNFFKITKVKTKKNKTQLNLASSVQTIKELYTSTCNTPKGGRTSTQPQSFRESVNEFTNRNKVGGWGLEMPRLSVIEKPSPRNFQLKTEKATSRKGRALLGQKLGFLKSPKKKLEKSKTISQMNFSMKTIQSLKTLYQPQTVKGLNSPKARTAVKIC